ncbi:hypothetical protein [Candidatus Methylobacter favarea]|uniref:hypothetical protein n=1 Tax=Candidatus Methylobacter favarea TaxID=2707345 RepID=UPI00157D5B5F|nr:hypothetical protein [Candidatus Methylobacter favarea]
MIIALHSKINRLYLRTLVLVLLVSWISLTISATCSMPSAFIAMPDPMPGCPDTGAPSHLHHQDSMPKALQDCSFKPCLDSQPDSFPDFNRLTNPDLPVVILSLIWTYWYFFPSYFPTRVSRIADPPLGRRILLIYRFCTLLN